MTHKPFERLLLALGHKGEAVMRLPSVVALVVTLVLAAVPTPPIIAHPGGLDAQGCHTNHKTGEYHCHRRGSTAQRVAQPSIDAVFYPNCAAARVAGAAPIYRGQPGYAEHLDRDGDGIA